MSNATGRTSAAQVRSASESFGFDYRMYHDDADLASDKDSRDKRAEARAKARETAANLVATRDAPARHQGREIVAATFAALDGVAPNNIRSPTTEATEVTAMLAMFDGFSAGERRALFHDNAARFYRLDAG